jgi:hypothetical protein
MASSFDIAATTSQHGKPQKMQQVIAWFLDPRQISDDERWSLPDERLFKSTSI